MKTLLAVAALVVLPGCLSAFYKDSVREYRVRAEPLLSPTTPEVSAMVQVHCPTGEDDQVDEGGFHRCRTTVRTAELLTEVNEELAKAKGSTEILLVADLLAADAAKICQRKSEVWGDMIKYDVERARRGGSSFNFNDALAIMANLQRSMGTRKEMSEQGENLLRLAKESPHASAKSLALEVNSLVDLALNPNGSLNSYRAATTAGFDRLRRARLEFKVDTQGAKP